MSRRRIVSLFAVIACATIAAPAGADPECFDGVCRMPEVIEAPEPSAAQASAAPEETAPPAPQQVVSQPAAPLQAVVPPAVTQQAAQPVSPEHPHPAISQRLGPPPEPIRPQMRVDDHPRPGSAPKPGRAIQPAIEYVAEQPVKQPRRAAAPPAVQPDEPIEVVSRRYGTAEPPQVYAPRPVYHVQPSAGVVVVAPGAQYGADGIAVANARQDSSWHLCQVDRPGYAHNRCMQYNYQPYGAYGYRPLGSYREYKQSPSYVYVPDAKVITID
jgi:hypothetical protein